LRCGAAGEKKNEEQSGQACEKEETMKGVSEYF
jgi:hypothetical protein